MIQKKYFYFEKILKLQSILFKRMLLVKEYEISSLLYWRTRILFSLLLSGTLLGLFVFISFIPVAIESKLWGLLFIDGSAWLICLLLLILPRISYKIRATIAVLNVYGIGLFTIFYLGPINSGPAWLFCFSVFTAILIGSRAAIIAVLANAITIFIIAYLILNNILGFSYLFFSAQAIYSTSINFLFLNALTTISVSVLIKGMTQSNEKEKNLSASLEKSENRYRLIAENVADIIWTMDMNFNFTYITPSIYPQRGFTVDEGMKQSMEDVVTPDSLITAMNLFTKKMNLIKANDSDGWEPEIIELEQLCKNNTTIWTSNNIRILQGSDKHPYEILGVTRDISRQKTAEQQIAEQEKHALVGRIAGKMAHDFNNILGAIMGNTELSLEDCKEAETRNSLKLIFDQTVRGKNLTKNLVAFAKNQEPKQEFFEINKKIELVVNLLKKDLKEIEIIRDDQQEVPQLFADPGMIEHALVNLLQNSIHALSLTDYPRIIIQTYFLNDHICFEIEDNGCGIPKKHLETIYELAFTLKGSKDITDSYKTNIKGTGYGMSNVKKYIEQHNGSISVESQFGSGTKFTIRLPAVKRELVKKKQRQATQGETHFKKHILLVEDEQAISDVQFTLLQSAPSNHKVDIANNGRYAINLFNENKYDLISLDYVLPGDINGMDIYHHIRKINKAIPILFISGNIEFLESIEELKQKDIYIDHLSKPCQNKDYLKSINGLLTRVLTI